MRQPFIAGNWKMHLTRAEAVALASEVAKLAASLSGVEAAVCAPFVHLDAVAQALKGTNIAVGAQNCYPAANGAFTGEVSPAMLVDIGCKYVILGHSERRTIFQESDAFINKKVLAVLGAGLYPILCVGELLAEREANQTHAVVEKQLFGGLENVSPEEALKVTIAYEPVWAIGTGKTATPEMAQDVHSHLRKLLASRYTPQIADQLKIQYGGSMKPGNAKELLAQPDIDGGLIGGASLKAEEFLGILKAGV